MTVALSEQRGSQLSDTPSSTTGLSTGSNSTSCFYEGWVRHRRFAPVPHHFRNRLFLMFLDLSEIDQVFSGGVLFSRRAPAIARFCRNDFLGDPTRPLADCVRETVLQQTGRSLTGPIRLLAHVRYFGFVFNPIAVYYCYDAAGQAVDAIVAEVSNTPWGEKHCYVVEAGGDAGIIRAECPKAFHVSPFLPMDLTYHWCLRLPGDRAAVNLECHSSAGRIFDATLYLKRRELTFFNRVRSVVRFPLMTIQVVIAIYWQAFRLWMKSMPFFPHPKTAKGTDTQPSSS